jgi:hypothetical protein
MSLEEERARLAAQDSAIESSTTVPMESIAEQDVPMEDEDALLQQALQMSMAGSVTRPVV